MPTTLDATILGENTNTYTTLADAEEIVTTLNYLTFLSIDASGWAAASDEAKKLALVFAADRIDSQSFVGLPWSTVQRRAWPRTNTGIAAFNYENSDETVPDLIRQAQVAEAMSLLNEPTDSISRRNVQSESVDGHSVSYRNQQNSLERLTLNDAAVLLLKQAGLIQTGVGSVYIPRG